MWHLWRTKSYRAPEVQREARLALAEAIERWLETV